MTNILTIIEAFTQSLTRTQSVEEVCWALTKNVIAHLDLSILFFTILNVIGIGYWAIITSHKPLFKKLTFLHSSITLFTFILIVILYFIPDSLSLGLDRVNSNSVLIPDLYITEVILFYTVLILILAQPFYVINIICALFRKRIQ